VTARARNSDDSDTPAHRSGCGRGHLDFPDAPQDGVVITRTLYSALSALGMAEPGNSSA